MKPSGRLKQNGNTKQTNYLLLTPKAILGHEIAENGLVILLVPRFKNSFWPKFFSKGYKDRPIHLKLDKLGSATWLLIDGHNNVENIINSLESQLGDEIIPATERVTKFLSNLYRDKFIRFLEVD